VGSQVNDLQVAICLPDRSIFNDALIMSQNMVVNMEIYVGFT
jgi:hypothetical protein